MAGDKNHPFQNFDSSKLTIGGESQGGGNAEVVEEKLEDNELQDTEEIEDQNQEEELEIQETENQEEEQSEEQQETSEEVKDEATDFEYGEEQFLEDFEEKVSELTGGRLKGNQIVNLLQENESLKAQLKAKPAMEFPSEAHRKIYEFATRPEVIGNELGAARQYLHLQTIDLKTQSPKEKQFEAFVLRRPDLTREKASEIFNATYTKKYSEMENDLVLQDEHDVATRTAEQEILKFQKEFQEAKSEQPAAQNEVNTQELEQSVDRTLSDFEGIEMQFGDSPDEVVQVPMSAEEVSAFREVMVNPVKLLDQVVAKSTIDGKFNHDEFRNHVYKFMNVDRLVESAYEAGLTNGQLKFIGERKNKVEPKGNQTGQTTAPKKTFAKTMADAVRTANGLKPQRQQ